MSEDLKSIVNILQNCIKNGHEVEELCKNSPEQLQSNAMVKQFIEKTKHETHLLEKLMKRISDLVGSTNDYTKWKKDLQAVIDSVDSISVENLNVVMKAVTRSASAKLRRKFEGHEKIIKDFKGDDVSMEFVKGLAERSKKIADCLNYVDTKLPSSQEKSAPTLKTTLYIMGDDLQKSMTVPKVDQKDLIGTVTVHDGTEANKSSASFSNQTIARQLIKGILQDEAGGTEIVLKYNEPSHEKSANLIDFSQTMGTVSATLEINGKNKEEVEIIEVNLLEATNVTNVSPPKNLVAKVKNNLTGEIQEVDVKVVPVDSQNEVHGRIVEIISEDPKAFAQGFEGTEDLGEITGGRLMSELIDSINDSQKSQAFNQIVSEVSKSIAEVINQSISEAAAKSFKDRTNDDLFGDDNQMSFANRSFDSSVGTPSKSVSQRAGNASRANDKSKRNISFIHNANISDQPRLEDISDAILVDNEYSVSESFGAPFDASLKNFSKRTSPGKSFDERFQSLRRPQPNFNSIFRDQANNSNAPLLNIATPLNLSKRKPNTSNLMDFSFNDRSGRTQPYSPLKPRFSVAAQQPGPSVNDVASEEGDDEGLNKTTDGYFNARDEVFHRSWMDQARSRRDIFNRSAPTRLKKSRNSFDQDYFEG